MKKAILIQPLTTDKRDLSKEVAILLQSAGYEIIATYKYNKPPFGPYCIGHDNIQLLLDELKHFPPGDFEFIIFGVQLTPMQYYNLTELFKPWQVLDKFQVVLELFDQHATTLEAKMQIRLARLRYTYPFEKVRLMKQLGKEKKGTGGSSVTGKGVSPLEMQEQRIKQQEKTIKKKLEKIRRQRELQRERRKEKNIGLYHIALVGYTSAGKSTLFSQLTNKKRKIGAEYFTTLELRTSKFKRNGITFIVSDTIGFLDDLPPLLFESFKSTLEESLNADILLLVIDVSEDLEEVQRKIDVCLDVLRELNTDFGKIILTLNKKDLISKEHLREITLKTITRYHLPTCSISAKNGELTELFKKLDEIIPPPVIYKITMPVNGKAVHFIHQHAEVISEEYHDNRVTVTAMFANPSEYAKVHSQITKKFGAVPQTKKITPQSLPLIRES